MPQEIHRYRRFKGWDYSRGASLFITIGVQPRRRLFREVVRRMERAVDKGYVVISGFISKGERAVRDMLCRRDDARFIRPRLVFEG